MKNTTEKQEQQSYPFPREKSRWAYWMQAIEPKDEAINKAFPGFHPQWVQQSQRLCISPEFFMYMRAQLSITIEQCAAYLRVTVKDVRDWESGRKDIPFVAFEVLRLILETAYFKLSHPAWDGWFISGKGILVSPNIGGNGFTPEQLDLIAFQGTETANLQREVNRLQKELGEAQEENTKLRQMFLSQGVVDELYSMHDRMTSLVKQLATARVIPFQAAATTPIEEKVA